MLWGRPVPATGPGVFVIELPAPLADRAHRADPRRQVDRAGRDAAARRRTTDVEGPGRAARRRSGCRRRRSSTSARRTRRSRGGSRRSAGPSWATGDRTPAATGSGRCARSTASASGGRRPTRPRSTRTRCSAAFAESVPASDLAGLPDRDVVLPWANLRRSTGERKATGLTGVAPARHRRAAAAADLRRPGPRRRCRRRPWRAARTEAPDADAPRAPTATTRAPALQEAADRRAGGGRLVPAEALTAEGEARLRAELDELTLVKRPQIIARIRTAKEHGDLKENAEYHAAREEQSFLEGRVQAIEARLRSAVIVEAPVAGSRVGLGSVVTVDDDGETVTYTIVGADESDPARGRISSSSPVGRAFVGRNDGDDVVVATPAGERRYEILEIA